MEGAAAAPRTTSYELVGVVVHEGQSADSGHYYSLVRHCSDRCGDECADSKPVHTWYCTNDLEVTPFDPCRLSNFFGSSGSQGSSREDQERFAIGTAVGIRGLQARPELNGRVGTIKSFHRGKGRYAVHVDREPKTVVLRPQNLVAPAEAKDSSTAFLLFYQQLQ